MTCRPSLSRCLIFWSVSTNRCSVSSDASSMGVWDVPKPSTILAIGYSLTQSILMLADLPTAVHF